MAENKNSLGKFIGTVIGFAATALAGAYVLGKLSNQEEKETGDVDIVELDSEFVQKIKETKEKLDSKIPVEVKEKAVEIKEKALDIVEDVKEKYEEVVPQEVQEKIEDIADKAIEASQEFAQRVDEVIPEIVDKVDDMKDAVLEALDIEPVEPEVEPEIVIPEPIIEQPEVVEPIIPEVVEPIIEPIEVVSPEIEPVIQQPEIVEPVTAEVVEPEPVIEEPLIEDLPSPEIVPPEIKPEEIPPAPKKMSSEYPGLTEKKVKLIKEQIVAMIKGLPGATSCELNHNFLFKSNDAAKQFIQEIEGSGFTHEYNENKRELYLKREDKLDVKSLESIILNLASLATNYQGSYKGWAILKVQ